MPYTEYENRATRTREQIKSWENSGTTENDRCEGEGGEKLTCKSTLRSLIQYKKKTEILHTSSKNRENPNDKKHLWTHLWIKDSHDIGGGS